MNVVFNPHFTYCPPLLVMNSTISDFLANPKGVFPLLSIAFISAF